jgi:hypothetical protein
MPSSRPTRNGRNIMVDPLVFTPLGMPDNRTGKWFDDIRKMYPSGSKVYSRQIQRLSNVFFKFTAAIVAPTVGWTCLKSDVHAPLPVWQHV